MSQFDTIVIPEKHYVGYRWRSEGVLGFITPFGVDAAGLKRMKTVDDWRDKKDGDLAPDVLDNVPMAGFRLVRNVSRYSTSNVVWRVMDPRGFELEISSSNMSMLLQTSDIHKGVIQTECVWARGGGNGNVLVSVDSEVYKDAVRLTDLKSKKVSLRDVKLGSTVILQNRTKCDYFGKVHFCKNESETSGPNGVSSVYTVGTNRVTWSKEIGCDEAYVLRIYASDDDVIEGADAYYYEHVTSAPKIAEILYEPPSEYTKEEVISLLNSEHVVGYKMGFYTGQAQSKNFFYMKKSDFVVAEIEPMPATVRDVRLGCLPTPHRYGTYSIEALQIHSMLIEPLLFQDSRGEWRAMIYQSTNYLYSVRVEIDGIGGEFGEIAITVPDASSLVGHNGSAWYRHQYSMRSLDENAWFQTQKAYIPSIERHDIVEASVHKYQTIGYRNKGSA
jgi:hypothetical protein